MRKKKVTNGTSQHALGRIQTHIGSELKLKLHSPRNFFTTCASQLLFPLEQREKLGHCAKGSAMPGRYDRAFCTTELRLRDDIISRISGGWRPQIAFEVPTRAKEQGEEESCDSTSATSTASTVARKREDISDLRN